MTLIAAIKLFNVWFLFYAHWLIKLLFTSYAKPDKTLFIFYFCSFIFSSIVGLAITVVLIYGFDFSLYPFYPANLKTTTNIIETYDFINVLKTDDLQKNSLEEYEKELNTTIEHTTVWVVTVVIVYLVVFSIKQSYS